MNPLDYRSIKNDFPLLKNPMNGKPLVFLDSAASSQKPKPVIEAFEDYYSCRNANIHRGAYLLSYEATDLYSKTRKILSDYINSPHVESVIFTRNATESINLVASSWGEDNIEPGDEIVISEMEHHSNIVPWIMLASRKGAVLRHIPLTEDFKYDYTRLDEVITSRTRIVSVAHMSNVTGTIHDIKAIVKKAKSVGAVTLIDGSQGAPHLSLDMQDIDCDFYALSAHKMLGPTGVGVLYGRKSILEKMQPYQGGGDMILKVSKDSYEPAGLPERFEAGTPNIAGVVSFAVSIEYIKSVGMDKIHAHELLLSDYAYEELKKIDGLKIYGSEPSPERGAVYSFTLPGVHPHDIGSILDQEGIAIRAGHHCCEPFMKLNGISGTARASFYLYNGPEDVDALVKGLKEVTKIFYRALAV